MTKIIGIAILAAFIGMLVSGVAVIVGIEGAFPVCMACILLMWAITGAGALWEKTR